MQSEPSSSKGICEDTTQRFNCDGFIQCLQEEPEHDPTAARHPLPALKDPPQTAGTPTASHQEGTPSRPWGPLSTAGGDKAQKRTSPGYFPGPPALNSTFPSAPLETSSHAARAPAQVGFHWPSSATVQNPSDSSPPLHAAATSLRPRSRSSQSPRPPRPPSASSMPGQEGSIHSIDFSLISHLKLVCITSKDQIFGPLKLYLVEDKTQDRQILILGNFQ